MDNEYTKAPGTTRFPSRWLPARSGCGRAATPSGAKPISGGEVRRALAISTFEPASLDGYDVDWPLTYADIAPYYRRIENMIGVASTVQNRPSNPDGVYLPPFNFRCLDCILEAGCRKSACPTCRIAARN